MSKDFTFSIIILPCEDKEELLLALVDLDYFFSKLRYSSLEVVLIENKKIELLKVIESFKKIIPDILVLPKEEAVSKIHGKQILIFQPELKRSFENFKKILSVSRGDFEIVAPYEKKDVLGQRILGEFTSFLGKILRLKKKIDVARDSGISCFSSEAVKELPVFNFLRALVFGKLYGYKVKLIKMPEGDFSPRFMDYLKTYWAMLLFRIKILKSSIKG